jgi:hypothetical protein
LSESILVSIKHAVGIPDDYDVFDPDVIMHINTAFATLNQLGIGPAQGFRIEDESATWDSVLNGDDRFNDAKSYVFLRVRMLFDPPSTSFLLEAMKEQIKVDAFLAHFGVKGMRWGIRKKKPHPVTADARQKESIKTKVKQTKIGSVSNADLKAAIRRMQLEQDFKRLKVNEQSAVTRWLSSTVLEIGKREVQAQAGKAAVKLFAKAAVTGGAG